MAKGTTKKVILPQKSVLWWLVVVGIVLVGLVASINMRNASNVLTSPNSLTPAISTKPGDYNEVTGVLSSPTILDSRTKEKYSFKVEVPKGWKIQRNEFAPESHTVVIQKDDYRFTISGPTIDESICNFAVNGDVQPLLELEQKEGEIGEIYDQHDSVDSKLGNIRFGRIYAMLHKADNFIDFNACQLDSRYTSPTWTAATEIGYINLRTPYNYDKKTVEEIKRAISSIEFIPSD